MLFIDSLSRGKVNIAHFFGNIACDNSNVIAELKEFAQIQGSFRQLLTRGHKITSRNQGGSSRDGHEFSIFSVLSLNADNVCAIFFFNSNNGAIHIIRIKAKDGEDREFMTV